MTRLPYPGPAGDEAARDVEQRIASERGKVLAIYRMLLHAPGIADGWRHLLTEVRRDAELPGRLREMVIMRVAALNRAVYEAEHHHAIAVREGVSELQLQRLAASGPLDRRSLADAGFTDDELDVLALTESLTADVRVDDNVFARVADRLGPRQVVELVVTIAAYNMVSRFLVALGIEFEPPVEG